VLEKSIETYKHEISAYHAKKYATYSKAIFLGRNSSYPFAMEAALKLKEIAYIFAQCYPAGELKHGPLALIDDHTPVFIFSHQDPLIYHKLLSNAQEVKARNGHIVAFVFEGQDELCALADLYFVVPTVAPLLGQLAMTGLMQFFMYAIAKELGCPIDKPRNLAKSVTVE
jgi:glucosamine--fructose-6-phosphate aminotransferase (isomerizing)